MIELDCIECECRCKKINMIDSILKRAATRAVQGFKISATSIWVS